MKYLDLDCLINLHVKIIGEIELLSIIDRLKPKLELSLNSFRISLSLRIELYDMEKFIFQPSGRTRENGKSRSLYSSPCMKVTLNQIKSKIETINSSFRLVY